MWFSKRRTPQHPEDIAEARQARQLAEHQLHTISGRGPEISEISAYLAKRRAQNHFGDSIQITFTRRTT